VEVERRLRHCSPAEHVEKHAHVRPLVAADDPRQPGRLAGQRADPFDLGIERRLQVLERERVVQDGDVAPRLGRGVGGAGGGQPGRADQARRRQGAQHAQSRRRAEGAERFGERAVAVEASEVVAHADPFTYPVRRMAAITRAAPSAGLAAVGAGSSPSRSRIQAAWRASTETIVATAASDGLVRFAAWPSSAATPRSSRTRAAPAKRSGSVTASPKSNVGAGFARDPSVWRRKATWARS